MPVPGGAQHALDSLEVTRPEAALRTVEAHRQAFAAVEGESAFERVIGVVVQPGVEFASAEVVPYQPDRARDLVASLADMSNVVFEAHSTDYQPAAALEALVRDGFAILKVGPWLTFALREALYGLNSIAQVLSPAPLDESLPAVMEALMLREPEDWRRYYAGGADQLRFQRHFSFSDRIRYYWARPEARAAVGRLFARLGERVIPEPLVSQYLGDSTRRSRMAACLLSPGNLRSPRCSASWLGMTRRAGGADQDRRRREEASGSTARSFLPCVRCFKSARDLTRFRLPIVTLSNIG